MLKSTGRGVSGGCDAAAANGRGESETHMSRTSSVYSACSLSSSRESGHSEDATSDPQRSLWPYLSI